MIRFGVLKTKILQKLTDAYSDGNRSEMKSLLQEVVKNNDFRDLYSFYEEIENKYFENAEDAKQYLNEVRQSLVDKTVGSRTFCESLDKKIGDIKIEENELYSYLDTFAARRQLKNADKYVIAKNKLIEHLTTKKEIPIVEESFTGNENLLHAVLANNFNVLYDATLNEKEKTQLKEILSISDKDLKNNFDTLKEEVSSKIQKLVLEEKNTEVLSKLTQVINEMQSMTVSKFNYYKLSQLKNGL
jgi:hypothetical protein